MMPEYTANYNLIKPQYDETADIKVINENMDTIDGKLKENADGLSTHSSKAASTSASGHIQLQTTVDNSETTALTPKALNTHVADGATIGKLGHVYHATLTTTLDTTWTGTEAPYSKTQTVTGIVANDNPIIDVVMSGNFETDKKQANEWSKIYRITTADNSITLYATDKPTVSLPIQLKVVR